MSASITLSKPMQQFVAEQTAARGFKSESEFVDQLLKEELKRMEVQKLVKKLEESVASGFIEWTPNSLSESRLRLQAKLTSHKKRRKEQ